MCGAGQLGHKRGSRVTHKHYIECPDDALPDGWVTGVRLKLLEAVNRFLSEARDSEFLAASLKRAGIAGLELAPATPGLVNNVPRAK